jgi:hypothetical protein
MDAASFASSLIPMKSLVAAAAVAVGMLALPVSAALTQSNSAFRSAEVVAGKQERLGVYGNVGKDCTSGGDVTLTGNTALYSSTVNRMSRKIRDLACAKAGIDRLLNAYTQLM